MLADTPADELVALIRNPETRSPDVVNEYYTRCIPYYRGMLGNHWHTGYYRDDGGPVGIDDQVRMEHVIAESAGVERKSKVLDVGCGMGGPACQIAQHTGARILGLTPNDTQVALARQLAERTGVSDRVTFERAFATELPVEDETFDVVLFFESPCHFPDRDAFFREAHRALRPGGCLAGEDWLAVAESPEVERYNTEVGDTWAIPRLGSRQEYASGMEAAGFAVEEAVDLRDECALLRGFLIDEDDRRAVHEEIRTVRDAIQKLILEGLLVLGSAAAAGAFTIGRFVARKS